MWGAVDDGDPPDARLIAAFRRGDAGAAGRLFRRHADALRRLAADRSDPDDLVAETFTCVLAVLRAGGGPRENLRPYLVATMRELAARWDRPQPGADELVEAAFGTLPARWRTVLWSTVAEGHTAAELAPVLGVSPTSVDALGARAREALRHAYLQVRRFPAKADMPGTRPSVREQFCHPSGKD
ncbi:DNA-directed RNA polymerase specialized sigma subunit, sigma24 family [Amycolatopsis pretoriensis]|uniref:DNA-directed RNA polymerase specialized sigma subunit, sigma24 family n=1 Tax=Amycolatopsis pretoriensis TaxID=218821 RepID=A0A1H5R5S5_9PSEU|nr:sigma-70 family RNA polymerase sigma factor [Amycolatopsis pretoriensis]SEF32737.1 DNA-directed RNA polymerase specialized sigma subunit, sigma24 family [Amycolatopsis pretoriensis]